MLVLTRHITESIIIDKKYPIKVTVLSIHKNQVSIGIEAPADISVHREEIFNRILEEEKIRQQQAL